MTGWVADSQLAGYRSLTIALPEEATFASEPPGSLVATLVRQHGDKKHRRAVLYLHGWREYFFQRHLAEAFDGFGYDFYALDLRRYGRSLREGQLAGFITDFGDYNAELDRAVEIIAQHDYDSLVLVAHSTGGLVGVLYTDRHPGIFDAVVLNSPWIELQGSALRKLIVSPIMKTISVLSTTAVLPMPDNGFYIRSLAAEQDGEWHFNPKLKGDEAFLIRVGWLEAVLTGHAQIASGLNIDVPVLVLTSDKTLITAANSAWSDEIHHADAVLDVERIASRVPNLGSHVTLVRLAGARHDVVLSLPEVRERAFDEMERFLTAYAG